MLEDTAHRKTKRLGGAGALQHIDRGNSLAILAMRFGGPDGLIFRLVIEVFDMQMLTLGNRRLAGLEIFTDTLTIQRSREPLDILTARVRKLSYFETGTCHLHLGFAN